MTDETVLHARRCEHGVRWPHECDDCARRDIPDGKSITDHPCHGLFLSQKPGELSHRAYITKDEPIYCERCGTELNEHLKQKAGASLFWEPRTAHSGEGRSNGAGEDATEGLGDALHALSGMLLSAGFLVNDVHHAAYDKVVAEFQHLSAHQGEVERVSAIDDIAAERRRQVEAEGWTPDHDDEHGDGSLAAAAATYAFSAATADRFLAHDPIGFWPWAAEWWKPSTPRRDLVKAGALIVAEIERIDRAALAQPEGETK